MNNDISDVNKFVKPTAQRAMSASSDSTPVMSDETTSKSSDDMAKSMNFLGAMGHAQVNMNNPMTKRVKTSVDSFLNNPEFVEAHTDLCDDLVKDGLPLEQAINVTDKIIDTLKTEKTYK